MGWGTGGGQGSEERHGEIRAATVAYIRSNRADFEPVTVESFGEGFDEYCDFMEVIASSPPQLLSALNHIDLLHL